MSWYKFWKKAGPMQILTEDYFFLPKEDYPSKDNIKSECESWAESMPGGHNTHYSYGFKKVKLPPREKLEKMLESAQEEAENVRQKILLIKKQLEGIC
jgi:hypothetical protein